MAMPFKFVLSREEAIAANALAYKDLPNLINPTIRHAQTIISEAPQVAIGRGTSGRTFLGVNVELPGLPLNHTIHAEQFLVTNLALNSEPELNYLAISPDGTNFNAPCGHCCQFLQEIRNATEIKILITSPSNQAGDLWPLSTFLQQEASPYNTFPEDVPLLLEPHDNGLTLLDLDLEFCTDEIYFKALAAANRAYAPYSGCPSGVALRDRNGIVYSGWCMESVAHNPSLGPVHAALVDFMANSGGEGFKSIVHAVLVEKKDAEVSQEDTARMILKKIASDKCIFSVLHCDNLNDN